MESSMHKYCINNNNMSRPFDYRKNKYPSISDPYAINVARSMAAATKTPDRGYVSGYVSPANVCSYEESYSSGSNSCISCNNGSFRASNFLTPH